jgi:regulator of sirC expression with transglutaminase-like and TPR domain
MAFPRFLCVLLTLIVVLALSSFAPGAGQEKTTDSKTVEQLATQAKPAIAVITIVGRDGKQRGLGTGFVVATDGLIATNLHVIGEARPITVQLGKKKYPVTSVHASDRSLDLALVKIDAKGLTALDLGDSDQLKDGQSVVALGHPRGLEHSVVSGVVSGRPKVEGKTMIQLAIPIESGNSGGPVLDMNGRVQGVVTLRSQVTANLGFAVPVNALKQLLKKPNPISIERWVTIGTLNPEEWQVVFEGRWRQRNGRIQVDGPGVGFGGRSLCLSKRDVPAVPFEIAVTVKLEDEAGAGGIAFHADGGDKHYGFYPSNGNLRLSRFEGPDVYSWKVLHNEPSRHYKPGEWNTLKVRVEKDRILCYVNDQLVVESKDQGLKNGRVGLAKFRDSQLEFKNFQVGAKVESAAPPAALIERVTKTVAGLDVENLAGKDVIDKLAPDAPASLAVLRARAKRLEQEAAQLRWLAEQVHQERVLTELANLAKGGDEQIDLLHAALLIAKLDNEDLDVGSYRRQVERMADELKAKLPKGASDKDKLAALTKDLFEERGFHGSRSDYYHRANSWLSNVLDDREGLPITLAVLYIELASRLGVKAEGVGLPGHFMVQYRPAKGEPVLIDVYDGGKEMTRTEAAKKLKEMSGQSPRKEDFAAVTKRAILARVLANLANAAQKEGDARGFLRYQDGIVLLVPDGAEARLARAAARYRLGDRNGAIADLDYLLSNNIPGIDREQLLKLRSVIDQGK